MELHVKKFNELTRDELYSIIQHRISVFVVEQKCPYMELDDRDQAALHVWLEDEDGIAAYLRVMDRGIESEYVSIGRVISVKRMQGFGSRILMEGISVARECFSADRIYLEAQVYAKRFYEYHGFHQISEEFIEDGIPHIKMLWCPHFLNGHEISRMIPRSWWTYSDGEVIPTNDAPSWLHAEFSEYEIAMKALDDGIDCIIDDRPRPDHPIIARMIDDDFEELKILWEMKKQGLYP